MGTGLAGRDLDRDNGGVKDRRISRLLHLAPVFALAGLVAACGTPEVVSEDVAAGQQLFRRTCAICHGSDAEGMPSLGKGLHDNAFVQGLSDAELVEFLRVGRRADHPLNERRVDMPPRGGNLALSDRDLALIAAYLRSIQ